MVLSPTMTGNTSVDMSLAINGTGGQVTINGDLNTFEQGTAKTAADAKGSAGGSGGSGDTRAAKAEAEAKAKEAADKQNATADTDAAKQYMALHGDDEMALAYAASHLILLI